MTTKLQTVRQGITAVYYESALRAQEVIANVVERNVGAPILHKGRDRVNGLDCVGNALTACWGAGIGVKDFLSYSAIPRDSILMEAMDERCEVIDKRHATLMIGSFVGMRIGRRLCHLGVVTSTGVVHGHPGSKAKMIQMHPFSMGLERSIIAAWGLPFGWSR